MADTATAPAPTPATGAPGTPAAGAAAGAPNAPNEQNGTSRGLPYYEKLRRELRDTLQKKRAMDKSMVSELRGTCRMLEWLDNSSQFWLEEAILA